MTMLKYLFLLLSAACLLNASCRRWYENEPYSQKEFIEYANERFRGIMEANGYSTNEFYPGELLGGGVPDVEANVRKRRAWIMEWKYRTEDWTYTVGVSEDGDSLGGSDKPGGFGPKPGFQTGVKWLQQKPNK
jgi:hypothetical protein